MTAALVVLIRSRRLIWRGRPDLNRISMGLIFSGSSMPTYAAGFGEQVCGNCVPVYSNGKDKVA